MGHIFLEILENLLWVYRCITKNKSAKASIVIHKILKMVYTVVVYLVYACYRVRTHQLVGIEALSVNIKVAWHFSEKHC